MSSLSCSVGIDKSRQILNNHLPLPDLLVTRSEVECVDTYDANNQQITRNSRVATWPVMGRILASEHQRACNATNATEPNERCTAECALPLPTDVIRLICHGGWNVGIRASSDKENTKVTDIARRMESLKT